MRPTTTPTTRRRLSAPVHPDGIDVLLDCVSSENYASLLPLVRRGGHAIGIAPPLADPPEGVQGHPLLSRGDAATLREGVALIDADVLHVHVGGRHTFDEANLAYDQLQARRGRGRVLLVP